MRGLASVFAAIGMAAAAIAGGRSQGSAELGPGDAAPPFSLPGSDGRTYSLDQFRGKQVVVLAWFPKAFTGG